MRVCLSVCLSLPFPPLPFPSIFNTIILSLCSNHCVLFHTPLYLFSLHSYLYLSSTSHIFLIQQDFPFLCKFLSPYYRSHFLMFILIYSRFSSLNSLLLLTLPTYIPFSPPPSPLPSPYTFLPTLFYLLSSPFVSFLFLLSYSLPARNDN